MHQAPEKAIYIDPALEQRSPDELQARLTSLRETREAILNGLAANQATIDALAHEISTRQALLVDEDYLAPGPASDQHDHKVAIARAERSRHGVLHTNKELQPELDQIAREITELEAALSRFESTDA